MTDRAELTPAAAGSPGRLGMTDRTERQLAAAVPPGPRRLNP
jgi:hypothetical protein